MLTTSFPKGKGLGKNSTVPPPSPTQFPKLVFTKCFACPKGFISLVITLHLLISIPPPPGQLGVIRVAGQPRVTLCTSVYYFVLLYFRHTTGQVGVTSLTQPLSGGSAAGQHIHQYLYHYESVLVCH